MDITAAEAARRLKVSKVTAVRWARTGLLAGSWQDTYTGAWHIPEESLPAARAAFDSSRARKGHA